ncbi:MAG TPA: DsbA family protein, partial [Casimicrobiaceae bacterium]|nr:DsbA family protein [Casimicrobiaceae bacterium]
MRATSDTDIAIASDEPDRAESDMRTALTVDVVSDIVCPWCFIGKRKLEVALGEINSSDPSLGVEVRWHPFQLNPDL